MPATEREPAFLACCREAPLLSLTSALPRLEMRWADSAYLGPLPTRVWETFGWRLQIVAHPRGNVGIGCAPTTSRPARLPGFQPLPHRWIVVRTITWIGRNRRMSQDDEFLLSIRERWIDVSLVRLMLQRLDHEQVHLASMIAKWHESWREAFACSL